MTGEKIMTAAPKIQALFLDIGGVLLSNGWDRNARERAIVKFTLDKADFDERHNLAYGTYEEGKLTLDEYLAHIVFYKPRSFTADDFKAYMFEQSLPYPEMIELIRKLKNLYHLKIFAVNNEGRELNKFRIEQFNLNEFFDAFISSCYVGCRKPDPDIYRLALDISQVPADQILYIDDRPLFVDAARALGIGGITHKGYEITGKALAEKGLIV